MLVKLVNLYLQSWIAIAALPLTKTIQAMDGKKKPSRGKTEKVQETACFCWQIYFRFGAEFVGKRC